MSELIAAIATAPAPSGVGIIRLSGPGAAKTAGTVFRPRRGPDLDQVPPMKLLFGQMCSVEGQVLDEGLAFHAKAPHSYTGEDTAELHCHGSPMVLSIVLEALFALGARQALPGEFTQRAFLNGKLDLMQAEGVIDLIQAETPGAAVLAAGQLQGSLSQRVEEIYSGLVDLLAHFYAVLDYPDEDIDPFRAQTIQEALKKATHQTQALLATYERGRQIHYGVPSVILGRPNVGKSSLLNALAGFQRAIVTHVPGTTRDTIEERVNLGGVLLRLVDTAGLRETGDLVEQIGVERSRQAAQQAELALLVLDASAPLTKEDEEAIELANGVPNCICVLNKSDLPRVLDREQLEGRFSALVELSAATGAGLEELKQAVEHLYPTGLTKGGEGYLTNARQKQAAQTAQESLCRAMEGLNEGLPPDLVLHDVESALGALGELSGRSIREDVTARIFERFCVGK